MDTTVNESRFFSEFSNRLVALSVTATVLVALSVTTTKQVVFSVIQTVPLQS